MGLLLGCIADDFTGATDIAALLARSGLPVALRIGVPDGPADPDDLAMFEVIALKCRTAPVDDAVADAGRALQWLKQAGATHFFWKYCSTFDSTRHGNIGPIAEMLMTELGVEHTIYCPAFPQNGRSVFMGHLFVGHQLLSDSPMKDHPLTPMRDSSLMRLLAPQVRGRIGLIDHRRITQGADAVRAELQRLREDGVAHVVVDAISDEDLHIIAAAAAGMRLLTGGSALAGELPEIYRQQGLVAPACATASSSRARGKPAGGQLVLSGSCSAMTRKQARSYAAHAASLHLDPISLARDGTSAARKWLQQQSLHAPKLISATSEPEDVRKAQEKLGAGRAGQVVEHSLAELAQLAFELGVRRFVVAGGETSGAIIQALGITRLQIGPEIAPGVPWTFADVEGERVALALKSGNFGGETFFDDAFSLLEAA